MLSKFRCCCLRSTGIASVNVREPDGADSMGIQGNAKISGESINCGISGSLVPTLSPQSSGKTTCLALSDRNLLARDSANINKVDSSSWTPLYDAIARDSVPDVKTDKVRNLLAQGADPLIANNMGTTSLENAINKDDFKSFMMMMGVALTQYCTNKKDIVIGTIANAIEHFSEPEQKEEIQALVPADLYKEIEAFIKSERVFDY